MATSSRKTKQKQPSVRRFPTFGPVAKRRIVGSFLVLLGLVSALSLLFPYGAVAQATRDGLRLVAGWGAMSIPVAFLWAGAAVLQVGPNGGIQLHRSGVAGVGSMVAAFLGLLHLLPIGEASYDVRALAGDGGGVAGRVIIFPLEQFGLPGTLFVLAGLGVGGMVGLGWLRPREWPPLVRSWWGAWKERRAQQQIEVLINANREPAAPAVHRPIAHPEPAAVQMTSTDSPDSTQSSVQKPQASTRQWTLPPVEIFESIPPTELSQVDIRQRIKTIEDTLRSFNVEARVVEVNQGPAITQFGVEPGVGVKVNRIMSLANDLALRLAAAPLRLEAPVPGKQVVGIEVPNGGVSVVGIRDLLESQQYVKHKGKLRLALGRDVSGSAVISDLAKMPHLLIAGATGSGKSVCLNSFVAALLYQSTPDELRMLMIDPKMVELAPFNGIPHLLTPVVMDMEKVVPSLKWVVKEMERRYRLFVARGVRNIDGYNRAVSGKGGDLPMPYLVVIIDELADLMMTAPDDVEKILCRLAQLARATGIHLVVATQRPSVDVVTGLIKANFPTRIAFAVTSQIDSRVILDQSGAERLLGRGDMLFMPPEAAKPMRLQGTYVADGEILEIVDFWKKATPVGYVGEAQEQLSFEPVEEDEGDDLYDQAVEEVSRHAKVSTSFLQRHLKIGYNRAARLMELLEENGVVGSADSGKAREVLIRAEESEEEDSSDQ